MQLNGGHRSMSTETRTGSTLFGLLENPIDEVAWGRFVDRHQGRIRQWCIQWGSQDADADDLCQVIFCKLMQQLKAFRYDPQRGKFRSWLKTVTRNTWLNLRKEPRAMQLYDQACEDCERMLREIWERELFDEAVSRVMRKVDRETWRVFELYVLEDRHSKEVATMTRKSIPAIYMAKYRVGKLLTEEIRTLAGEDAEKSP